MIASAEPLVTATSNSVKPATASLKMKVAMKGPSAVAGTPTMVTVGRVVSGSVISCTANTAMVSSPRWPAVS